MVVQPIITATGNMALRGAYAIGFIDLGGGPLFTPWYNSQEANNYNMGSKWRSSYHMRLTFPSSSQVAFEDADGTPRSFTKNADGSYTPEPGYHAKLVLQLGVYTLTLTSGRKFVFDITGKLTAVLEPDAIYHDAVSYDANGRLSSVQVVGPGVPPGRTLTLGYDASSRMISVTDFSGRHLQLTYDANGRVSTVTDPVGLVTTYGYDSSDRITSVTRNNHTWSYIYDNNNFVASVTDPVLSRNSSDVLRGIESFFVMRSA